MQICFFDTEKTHRFRPLTLTRPLDDLRVGILTIREKWQAFLKPDITARLVPDYLTELFPKGEINKKESCFWINPHVLPDHNLIAATVSLNSGEGIFDDEELLIAKIDGTASYEMHSVDSFSPAISKKMFFRKPIRKLDYIWDMLTLNAVEIENDIQHFGYKSLAETGTNGSFIAHHPENVFVTETSIIEPGSILIASDGPVFIGEYAKIEAGSIIRGPVAICENAETKMGCRISGGTTIGPVCKAGGEISNTIFHSYSNKAHDGYTGNSIFGQWCNLAAGTITSNLNINYKAVQIKDWDSQKLYEEGVQFIGTIMGDHSKTSINTMLNTGTVCGVGSNVFSGGFSPKYIPSFTWLSTKKPLVHQFDKAVVAMRAMMGRRNVEMSKEYERMMFFIYEGAKNGYK